MVNRAKLLEAQKEHGDELVRIQNKVADGSYRSSTILEVQKRVLHLQNQFDANDKTLTEYGVTAEDYFTQNYYKSITMVVNEIWNLITKSMSKEETCEIAERIDSDVIPQTTIQALETGEIGRNEVKNFMKSKIKNMADKILQRVSSLEGGAIENLYMYFKDNLRNADPADSGNVVTLRYYDAQEIVSDHKTVEPERFNINNKETFLGSSALLRQIEIPVFNGDINEWASFHDMFVSLVHNCPEMNEVEKMWRLISSLKGSAQKLVQHLKVTEANYHAAFDMRYENHRLFFLPTKLIYC